MKSLLARFPLRRVLGICLGDDEIVVSQVAATLTGPVQTNVHRYPLAGENPKDVLPGVLRPLVAGRRHPPPTAVGLPASRVFFGTRSVRGGSETTSQLMLQKMLCSSSIRIDDYIIDLVRKKKEGMIEPKKSLTLRVGAPLSSDGLIPREIDAFLGSLRNHPLLKRDFPLVDMADIKRYQLHSKAQPQANFTVICLPKTKGVPAAAAAEPGGEKEKPS